MKIIISSRTLDRSGVPTYTLTLYNELVALGHEVLVYSPKSGVLAEEMEVVTGLREGEKAPDIILAQHRSCATYLKGIFPRTPMIFLAHGVLPEEEQPPRINVNFYVAMNEEIVENLLGQYIDPIRIRIVRDFIDTKVFRSVVPLSEGKPKVLFISNYKKWRAHQHISEACSRLGLDFKAVGAPYGRSGNMAETINEADLIISWGRGILEAMSCGRAVISYDKRMGDGYITPDVYLESREHNFSGYRCRYLLSIYNLMEEIRKYDPKHGAENRRLVMNGHNSKEGVDRIMDIVHILARRGDA